MPVTSRTDVCRLWVTPGRDMLDSCVRSPVAEDGGAANFRTGFWPCRTESEVGWRSMGGPGPRSTDQLSIKGSKTSATGAGVVRGPMCSTAASR
jgi:hypothetical protein